MSAEEGSAQPPVAGNDKAPAAKPAATFTSSFINKNTTGKKFAPKAARRRPGAVPAVTAPKPSAPEPTPPVVEAQTSQAEPESSVAADKPAAAAQLPTPAATQEPSIQTVPQATPSILEAVPAATVPSTPQDTAPIVTEPLPTLTHPSTVPPTENVDNTTRPSSTQPPHAVQDEPDTERAAKRRRMEPPGQKSSAAIDTIADTNITKTSSQPAQSEADVSPQPRLETPATSAADQAVTAVDSSAQSADISTTQPDSEESTTSQSRKKRVLPWAAINRPQPEEEEVAPSATKKTRQPPKPRGRKKAAATTETQDGEEQDGTEGVEGSEAPPVQKRPGAKARGKRQADTSNGEDGTEAPAPAKRTRRPRKAKNAEGAENPEAEGEEQEQAEEGGELVARRKPRQPRRKRSTVESEGEVNQDPIQPKRRGRPPREPTPEDAENHEIDPEVTFMDSIASRNIRVGKLSDREKAMREIDWVAVRQRQREEDARPITTKEAREAAEKLLIEEVPQNDGPRYQVVNGQIQVIHDSTMVNREAEADREIENYEMVEERDLTTRITSRSFLKNNKRFPNDFLLPGQGKRWTRDDTELFYQGLRNFGTDFQMISHMFPGSTRRSIKLKFTREERDDPERVREALLGQSTIVSGWDDFMQVSQMQEQQFADADEIKRQMAEQEAEMRERIEAAKAETLERKRQQREAGLLDDEGEGNEGGDKENGKGKKKRKGKEKQVTFQEEVGVEIVGNVDDDDTWGQE